MMFLLLLFFLSSGAVAIAFLVPAYADLLLIAAPVALASLYLLVRGRRDHRTPDSKKAARLEQTQRSTIRRSARAASKGMLVLDGSNVMHWQDDDPRLDTVLEVVNTVRSNGFTPGVVFDANAGYKLEGKYLNEKALARKLGLPRDNVMVVAKGNPADPILLGAARDLGARVVSNDRFRDWEETHPEIREPGHLIRGGYREGRLWLDLEPA